jgi:glycerol kinase
MNSKEFTVLGKALKALLKAGLLKDVEEIVDYMASEKPDKDSGFPTEKE